jgi:hypothetical protein
MGGSASHTDCRSLPAPNVPPYSHETLSVAINLYVLRSQYDDVRSEDGQIRHKICRV